jgi:sugar phosphate isomerase/epimerase
VGKAGKRLKRAMGEAKLKFGFNCIKKPVEEYFRYASNHGMAHLEIDLIKPHSFIETFNARRISNLKKLASEHDISLSLHTPFTINPADLVPMFREANVKYLRKCVRVANMLRATHITTHVGYYNGLRGWSWARREALQRLVSSLKGVLEHCKKYEVTLALENVNPMPEGSEFFYLGDSIKDIEFLFSRLRSCWIKLCLDLGHAHTNEGVVAYIKKFGDKIINVHYHDNNGTYDDHLKVGEGSIRWRDVGAAFKKIGYCGPFISETSGQKPHEAMRALQRFFS